MSGVARTSISGAGRWLSCQRSKVHATTSTSWFCSWTACHNSIIIIWVASIIDGILPILFGQLLCHWSSKILVLTSSLQSVTSAITILFILEVKTLLWLVVSIFLSAAFLLLALPWLLICIAGLWRSIWVVFCCSLASLCRESPGLWLTRSLLVVGFLFLLILNLFFKISQEPANILMF